MEQFDFEQVGKRMPYSVPIVFFDNFEEKVMQRLSSRPLQVETELKQRRFPLSWKGIGAGFMAIAASVVLFFAWKATLPKNEADDFEALELAFNNLSTEDQEYLLLVYEQDEFIYNLTNYDLQLNEEK